MKQSPHGRAGNPFMCTARYVQLPHKWKKKVFKCKCNAQGLFGAERERKREEK